MNSLYREKMRMFFEGIKGRIETLEFRLKDQVYY